MAVLPADIIRLPINIPGVRSWLTSPLNFEKATISLPVHPGKNLRWMDRDGYTFDPNKNLDALFTHKYNFSYWVPGVADGILNQLTDSQLLQIAMTGRTIVNGKEFVWFGSGQSIKYGDRRLINLRPYVDAKWVPTSLDDLARACQQLEHVQRPIAGRGTAIPLNGMSMPLTIANHLLLFAGQEFELPRSTDFCEKSKLNGKVQHTLRKSVAPIFQQYHQAYHSRNEWATCGTFTADTIDQRKAFLTHLRTLPSLARSNVIAHGSFGERMPRIHPGSLFIISCDVPRNWPWGPIPTEDGWPVGPIKRSLPVAAPFLDVLAESGIDYKILWDYQILLEDLDTKPFANIVDQLFVYEDWIDEQAYPVKSHNWHYTITGHMLGLHYVKENEPPFENVAIQAAADYQPFIAVAVKALTLTSMWRVALKSRQVLAFREDSVSGRGLAPDPAYRSEPSGAFTFYVPNLRDKPGHTRVRELLTQFRDRYEVELTRLCYNSIHDRDYRMPLGVAYKGTQFITQWSRRHLPGENDMPIRNGEYLERELPCAPISDQNPKKRKHARGVSSEWIHEWEVQNGA